MIKNIKINRYFLPIPIIFFIIVLIYDYRHLQNLHGDYNIIRKEDTIAGIIKDIRSYKGTNFVIISDSKYIIGASLNKNYRTPNINDIMSVGDSIIKQSNNDTIYLFHQNNRYYFFEDKIINKRNP